VLYGRDLEREQIGALLRAARQSRSSAVVIRGEPGVGKSALLEDTRERAQDMHVLTARGVESESELPFAALHQLFRSSIRYAENLPTPQRDALEGALGLGDNGKHERFLVSAACLTLLSELAERRPVLCLIDDAHWLDNASADALLFVARRLDAEGVVILFGAREGDIRSFEARDVPSLFLTGLDAESSATLLARAVPGDVAPPVLERLLQQTAGNALALLELPAALTAAQLAGGAPLPQALPLTRQVETVFLERVRRLSDEAQRLVLIAAAEETGELALVLRASSRFGAGLDALAEAEHASLLRAHGTQLEFRHPLVRSAVYGAATSVERSDAHRALAEALEDDHDDRRAWHLASSVLDHDEGIAQMVEEVSERAQARGAHGSAARAFERAAQLSVDEAHRVRRLVAAAQAFGIAGEDGQSVALARQVLPQTRDPDQRADLINVLALAESRRGRPPEAVAMWIQAAREVAEVHPNKAIELLVHATASAAQSRDFQAGSEIAKLAETIDDERSTFVANIFNALGAHAHGDAAGAAELMEQALAFGATSEDTTELLMASLGAAWLGDDRRHEEFLGRGVSLARERGEVGALAELLSFRAAQLITAQRFDEAAIAATEALQLAHELGAENYTAIPLNAIAVRAAVRGEVEEAQRGGTEVVRLARAHGLPLRAGAGQWTLGLVEMGRGCWADALDHFDGAARDEPLVANLVATDRIEASIRAGRRDHAAAVLEAFGAWAISAGPAWARPRLTSCRALLADGEEATALFEEALNLSHQARPFDLARIHLLYGEHLRRERRRADARVELRAALEGFEQLHAAPWAERAASELRATGETARKRNPSTLSQLTPKEIQIARLVAEGRSNKEVAAQLFLSPRTIDYHLRNVFTKLGLTSRTQLAHVPLGEEEPVGSRVGTPA
jgi:DNA-binding CsgD family transcriptional regulator